MIRHFTLQYVIYLVKIGKYSSAVPRMWRISFPPTPSPKGLFKMEVLLCVYLAIHFHSIDLLRRPSEMVLTHACYPIAITFASPLVLTGISNSDQN